MRLIRAAANTPWGAPSDGGQRMFVRMRGTWEEVLPG